MNSSLQILFKRSCTALALLVGLFFIIYALPECIVYLLIACVGIICSYIEIPRITRCAVIPPVLVQLYVITALIIISYLYAQHHTRWVVYAILLSAMIHDTCAYLVGSAWGKYRLAPSISAGKTWEGCIAGFLALLITRFIMTYYTDNNALWAAQALCIALVANAGDLFESWLKRCSHLKDSGTFLPGHGGLLDRIDSTLSLTYLFFTYACLTRG